MNLSRVKRVTTGAALGFVFLFSIGVITGTTAQAQDRNRRWDGDDRRDTAQRDNRDRSDWNRRQQIERAREIERARQLAWERERARNRYAYSYPRTYGGGYGGSYGNYGGYGGGSSYEVQKGYRDGLDRGQEDLRNRRSPNPNNSDHYRSGNSAYREGFRRGYAEGYRQFGRGW